MARRLAREEGILVGGSGGMALHAALLVARERDPSETVLVILPDGGRPYLSKIFDDDWMEDHGMLDRPGPMPTVAELLQAKLREEPRVPALVAVGADQLLGDAIDLLQRYGISQMPVRRQANGEGPCAIEEIVGSIRERELLERIVRDGTGALDVRVGDVMEPPLRVIGPEQRLEEIYGDLQAQSAVVVAERGATAGVLTRTDLLEFLAHRTP
jgi:cystathionine beta-synthase